MTDREKLDIIEFKESLYNEAGGRCRVCNKRIRLWESQLAHRINKSIRNRKKYGEHVIHHKKNLVLVCSDKFGRCNDSVNISGQPMAVLKLVNEIKTDLREKGGAKIENRKTIQQ